jgi:membrane protein
MAQGWREAEWIALPRRAARRWVQDGGSTMGAALAYYALFSIAPLLLVAIWVAGAFMGEAEAQATLIRQLTTLVGDRAALAVQGLLTAAATPSEGGWAAAIGFATLLIGATTVFAELKADLDHIWQHPSPRGGGLVRFFCTRLLALAMVVGVGAVLLLSFAASAFVSAAGAFFFERAPATLHALEFCASFLVLGGLFAMIYKLLPSARIAWRDVWLGAGVTAALFWVGKFLIALYVAHTGVASSFGAAGAVVLVIVWVYYSAQVFFFGAELTREFAARHGSRKHEPLARSPAPRPENPRSAPIRSGASARSTCAAPRASVGRKGVPTTGTTEKGNSRFSCHWKHSMSTTQRSASALCSLCSLWSLW